MRIVAKTDIGKTRSNNQDSYAAGELPNSVAWAVVCDGMGGASGGNVASSKAVKIISERITSTYKDGMSYNSVKNMLTSAIAAANIEVFDESKADENLAGMGTTVVAAILTDRRVYVAHAGDSRAYILSKGKLTQITKDHSFVQEMIDTGRLTPDEAKDDPRKNIITRALGVDNELRVDFCEEFIDENDVVLICTDGLTNYVSDEDIVSLAFDGNFNDFAERLVSHANENGGGDNITVVTMSY